MPPLKSDPEYSVRRSARARRVRVTVDSAGAVIVTLPKRASERRAAEAVRELAPWIARRRDALRRAADEVAREPGTLPYLGATLRIVPEPGRTRVHRRGDELLVPAGEPREAIERFYRRSARAEIAPRLDAAVARAGTSYNGLTIRGQRTRWASCSSTGSMSFNWRLLLAPEPVLDYVIEHEVCHLDVMDHSPRFWALLESRVPGWREHATWLSRYGSTLVIDDSTLRNAA
jgi:predicted metal-dependent hydrolase